MRRLLAGVLALALLVTLAAPATPAVPTPDEPVTERPPSADAIFGNPYVEAATGAADGRDDRPPSADAIFGNPYVEAATGGGA